MAMFNQRLYLPKKYKVVTGTKTNISLCTCWTDPELIIKQQKVLLSECSIIGTLYSREGVSILLRNLCLNPYISQLIIWAHSPLSTTAIGSMGKNMLLQIWEKGLDAENRVRGSNEQIHKEIQSEIIKKVIEKVEIIDLSALSLDELIAKISSLKKKTLREYMKPIDFPETKRDSLQSMPSEEVGFSVRGTKLTETWIKVVDRIMRYGVVKKTEYGNNQKELQSVTWTVKNEDLKDLYIPDWPDKLKTDIGLDEKVRKQYKRIFLNSSKPAGIAYTYGNRLNSYANKIDQIEEIIKKLKECSITRRAFASTYYPLVDIFHVSPPCLTQIQLLTNKDNKLNMFASFRSHDIYKAAIPNAYGLLYLQKHIADKAGYQVGSLTITSTSAHIYEEDWQMSADTLKCSLWERNKLYFDEHEDIDPRGVVRILLKNNQIYLELLSQNGEQVFEYSGRTAREVAMKIARLDLLSRSDHYCDIAIELTKAELAMKCKLSYVQDRPFIINNVVIK